MLRDKHSDQLGEAGLTDRKSHTKVLTQRTDGETESRHLKRGAQNYAQTDTRNLTERQASETD